MIKPYKNEPSATILGLETSGPLAGVALLNSEHLIGCCEFLTIRLHSRRLLPAINWLLEQCEVTPDKLAAIAVSVGPGSFTGLRIGIAIAKTLAWQLQIPLVGVDTLEAIATNVEVPDATSLVCPVIDAKQGNYYFALFEKGVCENGIVHLDRKTRNMVGKLESIGSHISEPVVFCGDAILTKGKALSDLCGKHALFAAPSQRLQSPVAVAILGQKLLLEKPTGDTTVVPQYIRAGYTQKKK